MNPITIRKFFSFKKISTCLLILVCSAGLAVADELEGKIVYSQLTGEYWQIWSLDLKTKEAVQLTKSPSDKRSPQCNADGTELLFRNSNAELFLCNLADLNESEQRILKDMGTIMDERWSSDGKQILLTRMRSDLMDDSDIWLADLESGSVAEVTNQKALQYSPAFIGEHEILFVSQDLQTGGHNLWRKQIGEPGEGTQLTKGRYYDLVPDNLMGNKTAYFSSDRSGSFDIWQINLESNELAKLTDKLGLETSPSISPDGKSIIYVSTESGMKQLWMMNADGSNQVQLTDDQTQRQEPSWCPDVKKEESSP